MTTQHVKFWVVHRPLPGMRGHHAPGYYQITGQRSLEAVIEHVKELLAAGAHVRGVYDRANELVMDENAIVTRFGKTERGS